LALVQTAAGFSRRAEGPVLGNLKNLFAGRHFNREVILEAGRLLDEPIPRIEFALANLEPGRKMLEQCLRLIHQENHSWTSFNRLVDWLARGLAVSREMPPLKGTGSLAPMK
jgi:hypothetical protein